MATTPPATARSLYAPRSKTCLILLAIATLSALGGCGEGAGNTPDPGLCASDVDCANGVFCDGLERCAPAAPDADTNGCVAGPSPCLGAQTCEEAAVRCVTMCDVSRDADGDGVVASECGGADCDDSDADRFPGNIERCDVEGHDEDCDLLTLGTRDADGDGEISASCCNAASDGTLACGSDCDDTRGDVRSSVSNDSCDGADSDCDGTTDEDEPAPSWYTDCDGDGFGDPLPDSMQACSRPPGAPSSCTATVGLARWVADNTDCDDSLRGVNPGAPDVCDALGDNNCDGINPHDGDGDGADNVVCGGVDCNDGNPDVGPGQPDVCDGIDTDCDGVGEDHDGDGHLPTDATCSGGPLDTLPRDDCDDFNALAHPLQSEVCDAVDNNCDGTADEGDLDPVCTSETPGANAVCGAGACVAVCNIGTSEDCDGDHLTGCETNTNLDPDHCGECGTVCPYGCNSGDCQEAVHISTGDFHSCLVLDDGRVACAGLNSEGQLGLGYASPTERQPLLLARFGDAGFKAKHVSAGIDSTCVRIIRGNNAADRQVACFGANDLGQLGSGTSFPSSALAVLVVDPDDPLTPLGDVRAIASGERHHCAIQGNEGRLLCWGSDAKSATGTGTNGTAGGVPTPSPVLRGSSGPELVSVRQVTAGEDFTCALLAASIGTPGEVWCWGDRGAFRLGDGGPQEFRASFPVQVMLSGSEPLLDAVHIAAGRQHVCAARADGTVVCWGAAGGGQLGSRPGCGDGCFPPLVVPGVTGATRVGAAKTHSCAATDDGRLWCWGTTESGRVGIGPVGADVVPPTLVTDEFDGQNATVLDLGGSLSCALREDGRAFCWGINNFGQLGTGADVLSTVPVPWSRPL